MSKVDILLKRAVAFERLALYSDRKSFLQAIAQDAATFPPPSGAGVNAPYVPGTAPAPTLPPPAAPPASEAAPAPAATPAEQTIHMSPEHIKGRTWGKQLMDTVNYYISKVGPQTPQNMMDKHREAVAKQLDSHTIAELLRLYQQADPSNPYSSEKDQQLAQQIRSVVDQFGETFSANVNVMPNYRKLSQLS